MTKNKEPIPLFPASWIQHEINYSKSKKPYTYSEKIHYLYDSSYDPKRMDWELPNVGVAKTIKLLKEVAQRGADPNYVCAIMWDSCAFSKYFNYIRLDKVTAGKIQASVNTFSEVSVYLSGYLQSEIKKILSDLRKRIEKELTVIRVDEKGQKWRSVGITLFKNDHSRKKRGRPTKVMENFISLLLYRHLKKSLRIKPGYLGAYSYTTSILSNCFPVAYGAKHTRKAIELQMKRLRGDKDLVKQCIVFEKKYSKIGQKFIKLATANGTYENIKKDWSMAEVGT